MCLWRCSPPRRLAGQSADRAAGALCAGSRGVFGCQPEDGRHLERASDDTPHAVAMSVAATPSLAMRAPTRAASAALCVCREGSHIGPGIPPVALRPPSACAF